MRVRFQVLIKTMRKNVKLAKIIFKLQESIIQLGDFFVTLPLYSRRHEKCKVNKKTRKIIRFYAIFILKKTGDMYVPSG